MEPHEVARELMDALDKSNGCLFGTDLTFSTLVATVNQAMKLGWPVHATDIETLTDGDEEDVKALLDKWPMLEPVNAQLTFIFLIPLRD